MALDIHLVSVLHNVSTNGEIFPQDCPKTFAYDGSGNLTSVTALYDGKTYIQTLTYTAGKLTADSGFVKQ